MLLRQQIQDYLEAAHNIMYKFVYRAHLRCFNRINFLQKMKNEKISQKQSNAIKRKLKN